MATFCCTPLFWRFLTACCLTKDPPGLCVVIQLYVSGWAEGGDGEVQNWGLLTSLIAHPPPVPALGSKAGGAESDSQAEGESLAYLLWNFIIFNYLYQDSSPSLLPSLLLLSTLSRKHISSTHPSGCLSVFCIPWLSMCCFTLAYHTD